MFFLPTKNTVLLGNRSWIYSDPDQNKAVTENDRNELHIFSILINILKLKNLLYASNHVSDLGNISGMNTLPISVRY